MPGKLALAGIVTTAALLAEGNSERRIRTLTTNGVLIPVRRGAYIHAPRARQFLRIEGGEDLLRAAAALAVTGHSAVLSHQSAAQLFRIALLNKPGSDYKVTCRPGYGWRGRTGIRVHAVELPDDHVTTTAWLPTTTAARTVIDLARTLDWRAGVVAADSALYQKLTTKAELRAVIAGCRRWPGITRALSVVEFANMKAESPLESIARVAFSNIGLPVPELQVWVGGTDEPIGRADFYWRQYNTIAEADGALKYDNPTQAKAQLRRDAELRADGFEVVHFGWNDITYQPYTVAGLIRAAFDRGAANQTRRRRAAAGR